MIYSVKIWICTIVSAPILLMILGALMSPEEGMSFLKGFPQLGLLMLVFGFMFSIPALLFFWLVFDLLEERLIKTYIKKITLGLAGLFLVCTSFFMIDRNFLDWESLLFPASYSIALLFFVFLFKIPGAGNTSQG